jgi:hypothetical protein
VTGACSSALQYKPFGAASIGCLRMEALLNPHDREFFIKTSAIRSITG